MLNRDSLSYTSLYLRPNDLAFFSLIGTRSVGNRFYYIMRFVCYGDGSGNPVLRTSADVVMNQHEFYRMRNFFEWSRQFGEVGSAEFGMSKLAGSQLVLEVLGYHGS